MRVLDEWMNGWMGKDGWKDIPQDCTWYLHGMAWHGMAGWLTD